MCSTKSELNAWLPYRRTSPYAGTRLFCLPHAGAAASTFRAWAKELPSTIEVCAIQLPGREGRLADEAYTELSPLIEELAEAVLPLLEERPFAMFGHSIGALIAFELARWLRRERRITPIRLLVSGHRAPHLPYRLGPFRHLSDAEFVAALRRLSLTPEEVFDSGELLELLLPTLRADFAVAEGYVFRDGPPLDCPISVFGGTGDELVNEDELVEWHEHTTGECVLHMFPGDHLFPATARPAVLSAILHDLRSEMNEEERRGPGVSEAAIEQGIQP